MKVELSKPITILLYEDDELYSQSFILRAQKHRILVSVVNNVEVLFELLETDHKKYKFIVLDARAYLKEGQSPGEESESNLIKIFRELAILEQKVHRTFSCAINTGFADIKLKIESTVPCPIFEKGQEEKLFEHIKANFIDSDLGKLHKDHPDVISFMENYFEQSNYDLIIHFLKTQKYKSNDAASRIRNLAELRRVHEHIWDILYEQYLHKPLIDFKGDPGKRTGQIRNFINGDQRTIPSFIFHWSDDLFMAASNYGDHNPVVDSSLENLPSSYFITSLFHGLLETICWCNNLIKNK